VPAENAAPPEAPAEQPDLFGRGLDLPPEDPPRRGRREEELAPADEQFAAEPEPRPGPRADSDMPD
jgi:hypothetical protein